MINYRPYGFSEVVLRSVCNHQVVLDSEKHYRCRLCGKRHPSALPLVG